MPQISPAQVSFNGGELSPRIRSRIDQSIRSIAVARMEGWLPLLQGPAEACPGTIFVGKAKGPFRPIPYEFNLTQGYIVEAGDGYARFYTNDAQIMADGAPYEIATPWTLDQVKALDTWQSYDVLYCACGSAPLKQLYRTGADSFAVADWPLKNGPFEPRNGDETLTVSASATTGAGITITASSAIFEEGDVGGLFGIEGGDFGDIPAWEAGMKVTDPDIDQCQSQDNVYSRAGGNDRTGTVAPIHVEGTVSDGLGGTDINGKGPYGVDWTYEFNRYGLVQFTGYISPTQMTATVLRRLASTGASWRWRFGAFSPRRGYPERVCVWQQRLILAKGPVVHTSVDGDLHDFNPWNEYGDESADMAFSEDIGDPNPIQWLFPAQQLLLGTGAAEYILGPANAGAGVGPGNVAIGNPENHGSAAAKPVKAGSRVVFVQTARSKLIQWPYDTQQLFRDESPNLSRFADHLGLSGFGRLAWCQEPEHLMWTNRDDGTLAVMGYDPDEQYLAWATRTLGDDLVATDVAKITDPDGRYGELYIAADTGDEHWLLRMPRVRTTGDTSEQVMVDAAVRTTGDPTSAVSAPHLAGRTVDICADGRPVLGVTLDADGAATLDFEAADIIVGLPFPAEIEFLPPSAGGNNGPALGKTKRTPRVDLYAINSDTLEVECQGDTQRINLLRASAAFDVAIPLASGRQRLELATDYDGDMTVTVRRVYPRPSTLAVVMPYYESAEA